MTRLDEAERRLDDVIKNGTDDDISYWRGYRDALRAMEQANEPLTLEELRELEGEPVWVERYYGGVGRWAMVGDFGSSHEIYFGTAKGGLRLPCDRYGKAWTAYRRRPEGA